MDEVSSSGIQAVGEEALRVVGGLTTIEGQALIRMFRRVRLVGADVVEVAPPFDPSGSTALVAATMMHELLCILAEATLPEDQSRLPKPRETHRHRPQRWSRRASVPSLKVDYIQHSIARHITAEVLAIEKELIVAIPVGVVRDMRRHDDTGQVP